VEVVGNARNGATYGVTTEHDVVADVVLIHVL